MQMVSCVRGISFFYYKGSVSQREKYLEYISYDDSHNELWPSRQKTSVVNFLGQFSNANKCKGKIVYINLYCYIVRDIHVVCEKVNTISTSL